jgi:hypothetical protein
VPTVSQKARARKLFKERVKLIRPYVDFDYNLTHGKNGALKHEPSAYAKRKVKQYAEEIAALKNRPFQVYRPRTPSHLREAQEFAQHEKFLPGIKVAFIPSDGKSHVRIKFTKKGIKSTVNGITSQIVPLSERGLRGDAADYVRQRIAGNSATQYTILAGKYEIPSAYLPQSLPGVVAKLVAKYGGAEKGDSRRDAKIKNDHHWRHWLKSVKAHKFSGEDALNDYLQGKRVEIKTRKKARAAKARKKRR